MTIFEGYVTGSLKCILKDFPLVLRDLLGKGDQNLGAKIWFHIRSPYEFVYGRGGRGVETLRFKSSVKTYGIIFTYAKPKKRGVSLSE